jgi:hypothetical protein
MTIFEPGDGEPITGRRIDMGEKTTLEEVRDRMRAAQYDGGMVVTPREAKNVADAIDAHLATPAQTVDVEAVREVIAAIENSFSTDPYLVKTWADKLSQAIGDKT